ncbi:hypothetical protein BA895_16335 [Humibacillus sp. DSM 29435]|nr:hypothetical protein BA895_16335 [Humibacillus sp. DSM 29435]
MFDEFASSHNHLTLYSAICREVAGDADTASLLLAASPGQRRPVLWLAALHDLVLRRPDVAAARWYPSVVGQGRVPNGDPWPDVRQTVLEHREELTAAIATHSTQTNEVNRVVYLAAALSAACADVVGVGVALVEMGASAGLLLLLDHYRIERWSAHRTTHVGDPDAPVVCVGQDRSDPPSMATPLPRIVTRAGVDLHPVAVDDEAGLRWLEACLWPDVPGRVERFRAAIEMARECPPTLVRGDMVDDLAAVVALAQQGAGPGSHVVVFSSWALTYVAKERRARVAEVLDHVAAQGVPVSWVTAEPWGCMPGIPLPPLPLPAAGDDSTVLAVRRWREGVETEPLVLGTCHPHGLWIDLTDLTAR